MVPGLSPLWASLQFKNWVFCQSCGECKQRKDALEDGWLVSPYEADRSIDIVRCYRHITEWSLRSCRAGRSLKGRALKRKGRMRAMFEEDEGVIQIPPFITPVPLTDKVVEDAAEFIRRNASELLGLRWQR